MKNTKKEFLIHLSKTLTANKLMRFLLTINQNWKECIGQNKIPDLKFSLALSLEENESSINLAN